MDHELSESHHDDELKGDFLPPSRDEGEKQGEAFVPLSQEESEKHAETSLPFHVDESDIHAEETFHLESRGERKPLLPKEFLDEIDRLESSEEKLERVVAFMQEALGVFGT